MKSDPLIADDPLWSTLKSLEVFFGLIYCLRLLASYPFGGALVNFLLIGRGWFTGVMRSDIAEIADSLLFVRVAVQFSVLASVRRVKGVSFFDGVHERPLALRKVGTGLFLTIYCC